MRNVMILGDSYSTMRGSIPESFSPYYPAFDVTEREKTWWDIALKSLDANLVLNSSYSGTTVCHTGYGGKDFRHISFVSRIEKLIAEGFFEKNAIDELWIFGGTNDSWADSPIGAVTFEAVCVEEQYKALPAFSHLLSLVRSLPIGRILVLLNNELKDEITEGYAEICAHYGIPALRLESIEKLEGHPNAAGMAQIAEQFLAFHRSI